MTAAAPLPYSDNSEIRDIALDPNDWEHAIAITRNGVWETINAGGSWNVLTGNLNNYDLRTVQYVTDGERMQF